MFNYPVYRRDYINRHVHFRFSSTIFTFFELGVKYSFFKRYIKYESSKFESLDGNQNHPIFTCQIEDFSQYLQKYHKTKLGQYIRFREWPNNLGWENRIIFYHTRQVIVSYRKPNYNRLDLWLSSMLDCIHICVFLFFEKLFLSSR